jgi:CelD/BcsL family acetyltransferase involved in cellulose biosynthesis
MARAGRAVRPGDLATAAGLVPTPFHHPAWHETWLRHFRPGGDAVLLAITRGEAPVGYAALDLGPAAARELGDHNVRDYAGPVAAPGEAETVAEVLLDWLEEDFTRAATFWGLAGDDPLLAQLSAAAEGHGWQVERAVEAVCPGIDLPADFDAYVAGLGKHDRHELRRKLRHLEAAGGARFTSTGDPGAIAAGFDTFLALMRGSRPDKAAFLAPEMEAFFRDLAATFADLGMARLATLALDGIPAAMTFSFEHAGVTYLYNSGYDPAHAGLSVGLLSKALGLRDAIERGQRRFDFLRGDEAYKHHLGGVPREVVTLELQRLGW